MNCFILFYIEFSCTFFSRNDKLFLIEFESIYDNFFNDRIIFDYKQNIQHGFFLFTEQNKEIYNNFALEFKKKTNKLLILRNVLDIIFSDDIMQNFHQSIWRINARHKKELLDIIYEFLKDRNVLKKKAKTFQHYIFVIKEYIDKNLKITEEEFDIENKENIIINCLCDYMIDKNPKDAFAIKSIFYNQSTIYNLQKIICDRLQCKKISHSELYSSQNIILAVQQKIKNIIKKNTSHNVYIILNLNITTWVTNFLVENFNQKRKKCSSKTDILCKMDDFFNNILVKVNFSVLNENLTMNLHLSNIKILVNMRKNDFIGVYYKYLSSINTLPCAEKEEIKAKIYDFYKNFQVLEYSINAKIIDLFGESVLIIR